jgi:hypothetical protein
MHLKKSPKITFLCLLGLVFLLASCTPPDDGGNGGTINNPSSFTASPGVTTVDLSWSIVPGATGYTLERQESGGSFVPIVNGQPRTSFQDTNLKQNTSYTYRLKAVKESISSSGTTRTVTTRSQGSAVKVTGLIATWTSKQPVNSFVEGQEVASVTNAQSNVVISADKIDFDGSGEALYYIGGLCTKFTATVSGSGTFRVFADETKIAESAGGAIDAEIPASVTKQNLALVFQGTGLASWTNPSVFCEGTPTAPQELYLEGRWGEVFDWGTGVADPDPNTGYRYGQIVPTHAANMPDGSIATWAAWKETTYGNKPGETPPFINQTAGFLWNPGQGGTPNTSPSSFRATNNPTHDMFCAGLSVMPNGDIFAAGGGSLGTAGGLDSQRRTSYFSSASQTWTEIQTDNNPNVDTPAMSVQHWYPTSVALPDNRIFVVGGSGSADLSTSAEIRGTSINSPWTRSLTNLASLYPTTSDINIPIGNTAIGSTTANAAEWAEVQGWYPYLHVAPGGELFQSGPIPNFYKYDVNVIANNGSTADAVSPEGDAPAGTAQMRTWGNSIMYDEGKILVTGGSVIRGAGATNTGILIDINGAVRAEPAPPMRFRRAHQNSVVLPTGDVLIIGGNNSGKQFTDGPGNFADGTGTAPKRDWDPAAPQGTSTNANYRWATDIDTESVLIPELYSPDKNTWRDLAPMSVPRNYHSVGILLQDGRVLAAGGGLCGDLGGRIDGVPCNHPNGQVFDPPYLFMPDGTLAPRPAIGSLSVSNNSEGYPLLGYGQNINISMTGLGEGTQITKFSMIKLSAVTHSINTDLRYLEYSQEKGNLSGSGTTYQLTTVGGPNGKNILTPGYYFLFAINDKGVPSVAKVVQVL